MIEGGLPSVREQNPRETAEIRRQLAVMFSSPELRIAMFNSWMGRQNLYDDNQFRRHGIVTVRLAEKGVAYRFYSPNKGDQDSRDNPYYKVERNILNEGKIVVDQAVIITSRSERAIEVRQYGTGYNSCESQDIKGQDAVRVAQETLAPFFI
jgi:hypothetical protein